MFLLNCLCVYLFANQFSKFPNTEYSAVKSMLTPAKLAGDIIKPVVEGTFTLKKLCFCMSSDSVSKVALS